MNGDQTKREQQPGEEGILSNDLAHQTLKSSHHNVPENKLTDAQKDAKKVEEDLEEDLKGFKTI